jgi:hypothetical protein
LLSIKLPAVSLIYHLKRFKQTFLLYIHKVSKTGLVCVIMYRGWYCFYLLTMTSDTVRTFKFFLLIALKQYSGIIIFFFSLMTHTNLSKTHDNIPQEYRLRNYTIHGHKHLYRSIVSSYICNKPWRPIALWDVEVPTFSIDNRLTDDGEVVSLTHRLPFTPRKIAGAHFC